MKEFLLALEWCSNCSLSCLYSFLLVRVTRVTHVAYCTHMGSPGEGWPYSPRGEEQLCKSNFDSVQCKVGIWFTHFIRSTKLLNQVHQFQFTKPNLLNKIRTLGTKTNLLNQIYQTKFTKQISKIKSSEENLYMKRTQYTEPNVLNQIFSIYPTKQNSQNQF